MQSDGKIVFGQGHAYSASWASVNRLRADGKTLDTVQFWPSQSVRIASSNPQITGRNTEAKTLDGLSLGDSIFFSSSSLGFSGNVAVDSLNNSTLVFKVNRGGTNLRSHKTADFGVLENDENGNSNRLPTNA